MIEGMEIPAAGHMAVESRLLSVNVGAVRQVELAGRPRTTAIWKLPVPGRVAVRGVNLVGDEQADRRVHGGPDKAVYAYAREDYAWWERQLGRPLEPGTFGENLTTEGIQVTGALVGERWRLGSVVLQVTSPRVPAGSSGSGWATRAFLAGSPPRAGPAPTWRSWGRGRSAPVTGSR